MSLLNTIRSLTYARNLNTSKGERMCDLSIHENFCRLTIDNVTYSDGTTNIEMKDITSTHDVSISLDDADSKLKYIIVDCSQMSFMDSVGAKVMISVRMGRLYNAKCTMFQ